MASNEDYLDELLKSMNSENTESSALNRLHTTDPVPTEPDMGMGKMDQAMIDALLAGASAEPEPEVEEAPVELEPIVEEAPVEPEPIVEEAPVEPEPIVEETQAEPSSMLAQLMAEMEEDTDSVDNELSEEDFISEAGIEALLNAAENTQDELYNDQVLSFDINDDTDMAEIEALLNMADDSQNMDENSELLKLLDNMDKDSNFAEDVSLEGFDFGELEAELDLNSLEGELDLGSFETDLNTQKTELDLGGLEAQLGLTEENSDFDMSQFEAELDLDQLEAELDLALGEESSNNIAEEADKDKSKNKKEINKKEKAKKEKGNGLFSKIFSLLFEEESDENKGTESGKFVSDENKKILEQLDQEEDKKIKVKEKKAKKEKKEKEKKEKPKKEKAKKESKPKKEKPKKEKKPKVIENQGPERKVPRKKVIVSFVFAFSVLAFVLLIEYLVPPMLSVGNARQAYDKGDYYQAYKEYYGQKLSEKDEVKFQAATTIMRMQSNLDGYYNYIKLNDEIMAIHSLLEGVHIKFEVFAKAEELGVLSQINAVYDKILEILNNNYHISEEEAFELIEEKSDAVYTRKLESLAESGESLETGEVQENWEDMLPEEEDLMESSGE